MTVKTREVRTKDLLKSAAHQNPALSSKGLLERMFTFWFDSFVYNQIWEDPRVDLEAMQIDSSSRILTISSGGCNVLNYLVEKPAAITAVDLNRNHISLLRLKLAAIEHLPSYEEFFLFFGCADDPRNRDNYKKYIAEHLDEKTREFWEGGNPVRRLIFGPRIKYFTKNFYDYAKLGYFIRFLHGVAKMQGTDTRVLVEAKTKEEREAAYEEVIEPYFNHWLVRKGGKLPMALYSLGIPPQQFKAMEEETGNDMVATLRERVRRLACDFPTDDNYFCWQAFTRGYDRIARKAIPEYLKEENFETLRENVHRVCTLNTTTTAYLEEQDDESHDCFIFLDSQDWMKAEQITAQWEQVARVGKPGARVIFRTAAAKSPIEESLPPELMARFDYQPEQSAELFKKDRSAIYGGFHLYIKP